jgi:predicted transcriptional regulator
MNAIAKLIGVSPPAVLKWIRRHAQAHCPKPTPGEAVIVELDEMWRFLKKKHQALDLESLLSWCRATH